MKTLRLVLAAPMHAAAEALLYEADMPYCATVLDLRAGRC